jgi:hypothetical protein
MQKYATRGHGTIEGLPPGRTVPNPARRRKRPREKAAGVAKYNAGLAVMVRLPDGVGRQSPPRDRRRLSADAVRFLGSIPRRRVQNGE